MTDQTSGVRQLELVIEGSRVPTGSIDLDTLAPLANGLLRALRAVAREQRGQPASKTGNPGRDIRVATGLRLVALRKGSTVLVWESAEVDLFGGVADETINQLLLSVGDDAAAIDTAVVEPLEEARRSLGEGGTMRFITAGKPPVVLDEDRIARLRGSSEQPVPALRVTHRTVTGWLHAADLEPNEIRIRDAENLDWICDFQSALRGAVLTLLGKVVKAVGVGTRTARRGTFTIESLQAIELPVGVTIATAHLGRDEVLRQAMAAQGVLGPQPLSRLRSEVDSEILMNLPSQKP